MLQDVRQDMTPLQKRLAGLGKVVALLCLGVCAAVFLAGILRGEPVFDSVICSDKTGTITENRMTVTAISAGGESFQVTGTGLHIAGAFLQDGRMVNPSAKPALRELLVCGSLCSTAELHRETPEKSQRNRSQRTERGSWHDVGDPTEAALLVAAEKAGISREKLLRQHPVRHMEPFDSETRRMAVTVSAGAGVCTYWKGAADCILEQCGFQMLGDKTVPLTAAQKRSIREQAAQFSDQALRVLALARQDGTGDCVFLGLAAMIDPPRESAAGRAAAWEKGDDRRRAGCPQRCPAGRLSGSVRRLCTGESGAQAASGACLPPAGRDRRHDGGRGK